MVGDYEEAEKALLRAKEFKPNDHDIANELKKLDRWVVYQYPMPPYSPIPLHYHSNMLFSVLLWYWNSHFS